MKKTMPSVGISKLVNSNKINRENDPTVSIVIPVYNEESTIEQILRRVDALNLNKEIIVVDDASSDQTRKILKDIESKFDSLTIIFQEENAGKGSALRTGFRKTTGDVIVIQDADLELRPEEIPALCNEIVDKNADVVYGSRFKQNNGHYKFMVVIGNKILTSLSNLINQTHLTDMETCYKAFSREALEKLQLTSDTFCFEPEVTAKLANRNIKIKEIPVSYKPRSYVEGKKINWMDGFKAVVAILWFGLLSNKKLPLL